MRWNRELDELINRALAEDIASGDITTSFCIDPVKVIEAEIIAKEDGVVCGLDAAKRVFKKVDKTLHFSAFSADGKIVKKNTKVAKIKGKARSILTGERVALNFLTYLSGIATYTYAFVKKTKRTKVKIMDTRKTHPALRFIEKYAVRAGKGVNHRMNLSEAVLIKDNHLRASGIAAGKKLDEVSLRNLINNIRKSTKKIIEIEVETLQQLQTALKIRPDIIMLDNFSLNLIKKSVKLRNALAPRVKLEVSGRVSLANVGKIAKTGIDFISIGSITHSAKSLDFSLEICT